MNNVSTPERLPGESAAQGVQFKQWVRCYLPHPLYSLTSGYRKRSLFGRYNIYRTPGKKYEVWLFTPEDSHTRMGWEDGPVYVCHAPSLPAAKASADVYEQQARERIRDEWRCGRNLFRHTDTDPIVYAMELYPGNKEVRALTVR